MDTWTFGVIALWVLLIAISFVVLVLLREVSSLQNRLDKSEELIWKLLKTSDSTERPYANGGGDKEYEP